MAYLQEVLSGRRLAVADKAPVLFWLQLWAACANPCSAIVWIMFRHAVNFRDTLSVTGSTCTDGRRAL